MKPGYFEVQRPRSSRYGMCSDNQCPCNEDVLSPGNGYLYISEDLVQFRKDALTLQETEKKVLNYRRQATIIDKDLYVPILMCKQGALRRGIDMEIAAADAEYFWETGLAPLRPTPKLKLNHRAKRYKSTTEILNEKKREQTTSPLKQSNSPPTIVPSWVNWLPIVVGALVTCSGVYLLWRWGVFYAIRGSLRVKFAPFLVMGFIGVFFGVLTYAFLRYLTDKSKGKSKNRKS